MTSEQAKEIIERLKQKKTQAAKAYAFTKTDFHSGQMLSRVDSFSEAIEIIKEVMGDE